jgi:flagellar biosynthesis/type III secretory pathway M-ring protein FliF/YscJ
MDELHKIAPKLSKIKKEQPFGVPENYFDEFSARLQTKLEAEKRVLPQQKNRVIRLLKPAIGLAASFIVIFLLVYLPIKSFLPNYTANNIPQAEQVETEINEEDDYITLLENIDENSFFSLLQESFKNNEPKEEDFNDEELLSYLSSNISDYEIYIQNENINR